MSRFYAQILRTGALGIAMLLVFGCGFGGTTIVQGGGTPAATATHTPTPTPTPRPVATPTAAHLLVTIIPNPTWCANSGASNCNPYACHNGTTCSFDWTCLSPAWPTIQLSDSGQVSLTWHTTITQYNPDAPPWTLSQTSGTLGGGDSTNLTITNGPGGGMQIVFTGAAQTVMFIVTCGVG